eukprot:5539354-Amphidinium_carterae.1
MRRQRFNAQPIYDVLYGKLPDMDARDAMRGANLLAEAVGSSWGFPGSDKESELSLSEPESASPFCQGPRVLL